MFTYIDPTVRERLVAAGKLFRIDRDGNKVAPEQPPAGRRDHQLSRPDPDALAT